MLPVTNKIDGDSPHKTQRMGLICLKAWNRTDFLSVPEKHFLRY